MIISAIFYVVGALLAVLGLLLGGLTSLFSFVIPDFISAAIVNLFGSVAVFQGVLPIVATPGAGGIAETIGILDVFGFFISFALVFFGFLLIRFLVHAVPWLRMRFGGADE